MQCGIHYTVIDLLFVTGPENWVFQKWSGDDVAIGIVLADQELAIFYVCVWGGRGLRLRKRTCQPKKYDQYTDYFWHETTTA